MCGDSRCDFSSNERLALACCLACLCCTLFLLKFYSFDSIYGTQKYTINFILYVPNDKDIILKTCITIKMLLFR